jgi:class 3 adenylate cyclase/tetratricopeptide (TPR) repeat protein
MAEGPVQFAEFELDRAAYQLRREGRIVRLERIPLDLLLFLVERRGQLVTREEIRNRIWGPNVVVDTENSINTAIGKLRRVLRDRPNSPRFIETVPAKGYRFIAAINEPTAEAIQIRSSEFVFTHHASEMSPERGQAGERRHLTVLACDLRMNSISRATESDPEERWEKVAGYHRAAVHAVKRYGGHVGPYRGDSMMAYFGWPQAHDSNAENAVRAGLAILEEIAQLDRRMGTRPAVSSRISIHSGTAVVGARSGGEGDIFGDTPDIAIQVRVAAPPRALVMTAATHQLVHGLFVTEDCGVHHLKGYAQPVNIYRVVRPNAARGQLDAITGGLTPFVGREEELRLLMNRWERTLDGEGQVALLIGEPGIGKSRLLQHLHEQIVSTPHTWVQAAAAPSYQNTPFYPIAELLRQLVIPRGGDGADEQLTRLERRLASAGLKPAEAIPLIAPLLNLTVPVEYPPLAYSAEQQRRRLFALMVGLVLGAARMQPLVIATEDLHWADPSTLELIQILVEQAATGPLLLLYTARPEFRAQWPWRAHHTQITLNGLNVRSVRIMVGHVAARKALSDETVAAIVERTGGVPLFVEELTRAVLEAGDEQLNRHEIPVTLHDSLMARLDRLGPVREVAQVGAVIGRDFSYELLHAVHPVAEDELKQALHTLADADLLYVRGIAPEAIYQFKHALIRDAAYQALLKSRRKELHRQVARTIEEKFSALKEMHPELLARHWTEAGETERAVAEWERAGRAAEGRSAFREALASYHEALKLLELMPDSPERDVRELALRHAILIVLLFIKGGGAAEAIDAAERAIAVARKSGNLSQLSHLMTTRAFSVLISGDISAAAMLANEASALAVPESDPQTLSLARALQLFVCWFRGDLAGAEQHFAAGLKLFENAASDDFSRLIAILAFGVTSCNAYQLGRVALGRERQAKMRQIATNKNNQYEIGNVGFMATAFHNLAKEYEEAEPLAAHALELAEKGQFAELSSHLRIQLGNARARLGRTSEGIALIRRGIAGLLKIAPHPGLASFFTLLAAAQQRSGETDDALETIEQSLRVNPEVLLARPEALRVRGQLRLEKGQAEQAETDFRDSIALARSMGAKAFELSATTSLARLLASRGRRDEARTMLTDIYNWFTEGLDTADLKDAKALLDELDSTAA